MPRRRFARALGATLALGALGWLAALAAYALDPVPLGTPVRGVASFHSTFGAPRSGGRHHQGVDVFAARGTPVLAAHAGLVVRVGTNTLGGRVVHTLGRRGVLCYYAHLDDWAPGLAPGRWVAEGEVLGFVGNTGNARTTPPHLHFEARPLALGLLAVDPVSLLPRRRPARRGERLGRTGAQRIHHEFSVDHRESSPVAVPPPSGPRRGPRGGAAMTTRAMRVLGVLATAWAMIGCAGAQHAGEREDPEAVVLEGALGNTFVPAGQSSEIVARLRIGTVIPEGLHRPPINLALVIDTSGSMDGRPIDDARAATAALLDAMHDGDRLAVVAFHSETEVVLPSTRIDRDRIEELREHVSELRATGTTDLAGGLRVGLEEVMRHYDPQGINRVVLLSDGVPNDAATIEPLAQAAGERGIAITALGLGTEYDETLLAAVAQRSGGRFHYVEESSAVARVFEDEVLRMRHVLARNLSIELRPGPGVQVESVVGQPQVGMDGSVRVALGDVAEGESRDVIVRLRAEGRRAGAMVELMDAVLSFDDAVAGAGRLERRLFLGARATGDDADLAAGRNESVERDAARMMAAAVTVEAIRLARGGELDEARAILAQAAVRAEEEARAHGDEALAAQAQGMRSVEAYLPAAAPSYAPAAADDAPRALRAEHDRAMSVIQGD